MKLNNMTDENAPLKAGTNILISVNIVTPTPTPVATSTALP
jgi:hypothetical protein